MTAEEPTYFGPELNAGSDAMSVLSRATEIIAPVFAANDWRWLGKHPTTADIALSLADLNAESMRGGPFYGCERGRLMFRSFLEDDTIETTIFLKIGTIYRETV